MHQQRKEQEMKSVSIDLQNGVVIMGTVRMHLDNMTLDDWAGLIGFINEEKGWNEPNRTPDRWAALAHTEISEYYEEFRNGNTPDLIHGGDGELRYDSNDSATLKAWPIEVKPEGQAVEMADNLVRTLHWFAYHRINPIDIMALKVRYNATRPYRHGNKQA
jgi:hypothetical protein